MIKMIDIDIYNNKFNETDIRNMLSEFLHYVRDSDISYIEFDDEDGYLFINKEGPEDEWDYKTIQMWDLLNTLGFNAFLSSEDYGYIDVIILSEVLV